MSPLPPNPLPRRLPVAPPANVSSDSGPAPAPFIPIINPSAQTPGQAEEDFIDVSMFQNAPRVLTVNEQPFFRWFRRVFIALIAMSAFIFGVTMFVKAPYELAGGAILISWSIVLLYALPDAIMPYKKTKFDLTEDTVKVGSAKPAPLSAIDGAYYEKRGKNHRVWFSMGEKKGFWVPLSSSKFKMKHEDLLALRTIIPKTEISEDYAAVDMTGYRVKKTPMSKTQLVEHVENMIS